MTVSGSGTDTTLYTYYYDKVNTIGNENHGIFFYGRQNNTLLKSQVTNGKVISTFRYVFDALNRVRWLITTDAGGTLLYRKVTYL